MHDTQIHPTFNRGKLGLETTMEGLHHDKFFAMLLSVIKGRSDRVDCGFGWLR